MRAILTALGLILSGAVPALAQTGFYLPTTATSFGQDEFRAADGTTCRSSMDGTKRVEVGTYASAGQTPVYGAYGTGIGVGYNTTISTPTQGNAGVYGRFSMSLDAHPERMNCNKLFELEMERRRIEVEIMKRSLSVADHELDALRDQRQSRRHLASAVSVSSRNQDSPARKSPDINQTGSVKPKNTNKYDSSKRRNAPL